MNKLLLLLLMVYLLGNEVDWWYICVETRLLEKQLHWIYGSFCRNQNNVKVLLRALLFGCNVSSIIRNLCVLEQKTHGKAKEN